MTVMMVLVFRNTKMSYKYYAQEFTGKYEHNERNC